MRVLLADDETIVLDHLKQAIDWPSLGLELAGTVSNGKDALEFMEKTHVDILVTDIRMPGMDGLELCRRLRLKNYDTQIILLTGYADFEYARQAIQLRVFDYCLKPVDTAKLSQILLAAVRQGFARTSALADALLDLIEEEDPVKTRKAFAELGLVTDSLYVAGSAGLPNLDKALGAALSCKVGRHQFLYFSGHPFAADTAARQVAFAKDRCGIGLPLYPASYSALADSLDDVLAMTLQYFINGMPTLCDHLNDGQLTREVFRTYESKASDPQQLKAWLNELAAGNCAMLFDIRSAFRFVNKVADNPAIRSVTDGEAWFYGFDQMVSEYAKLSDILRDLADAIQVNEPARETEVTGTDSFIAIIKYLNEHFAEDVSLKKTADLFHLNASYVSQLIKAETGLTYTQYITDLRISKAKDLLRSTNLSLAEISEAVGFNDYFYFIKKFKKEVGVTPGKFA